MCNVVPKLDPVYLDKTYFCDEGPPQFVARVYNIREVTKRLFVVRGCYSFIVAKAHNILEVTKMLFAAGDCHSSLWPKTTAIGESQDRGIWVLFCKLSLLCSERRKLGREN